MVNTIEIKIECKGQAAGTLGWLNSIISSGDLVIKENKDGVPAMFLKVGEKGYYFICRKYQPSDADGNHARYDKYPNDILACFPVSNEYQYGFVDYTLTDAAEQKAKEFINLAVEKFQEWWENN